jgi:hypothetical protein
MLPNKFSEIEIGKPFHWKSKKFIKTGTRNAKCGKQYFIFNLRDLVSISVPNPKIERIKPTQEIVELLNKESLNIFIKHACMNDIQCEVKPSQDVNMITINKEPLIVENYAPAGKEITKHDAEWYEVYNC